MGERELFTKKFCGDIIYINHKKGRCNMFRKRLLSKLLAGIVVLSLCVPFTAMGEEVGTYSNWDTERYGDRVDVDAKLDMLSRMNHF